MLHSFLSGIIEEFLVKNSFAKPPQVQPRDESAQLNPRKRRKLADHTVSIYSPGQSQQSYRTAELGFSHSSQGLLEPCCSDCSGSCDGCSSCCDECLHNCEGTNPNPGSPDRAYYDSGHLESGEYLLSEQVFNVQVSFNLCLPRER